MVSRSATARDACSLSREPLGDQRGVKYTILIQGAQGNHPIAILNLASIDGSGLLAMLLTGKLGGTVVDDGPLFARSPLANGERRFIFVASNDDSLPTVLPLGRSLFLSLPLGCLLRERQD